LRIEIIETFTSVQDQREVQRTRIARMHRFLIHLITVQGSVGPQFLAKRNHRRLHDLGIRVTEPHSATPAFQPANIHSLRSSIGFG
jgi:hypothetical protein